MGFRGFRFTALICLGSAAISDSEEDACDLTASRAEGPSAANVGDLAGS